MNRTTLFQGDFADFWPLSLRAAKKIDAESLYASLLRPSGGDSKSMTFKMKKDVCNEVI